MRFVIIKVLASMSFDVLELSSSDQCMIRIDRNPPLAHERLGDIVRAVSAGSEYMLLRCEFVTQILRDDLYKCAI